MLETKSIAALAFTETPRKRKRETGHHHTAPPPLAPPPLTAQLQDQPPERQDAAVAATESCFTNAAFSSTPKKLIGRRRLAKENAQPNPFPGLEVKSIAALAERQQQQQLPTNPFEVLRQPSKKKKREHACFENPGLNLELPEKQFNPYEVVIRSTATPSKGFVNPGLNLRGSDVPASLNPFEIHRPSEASTAACNPTGVANPGLTEAEAEEHQLPTSLKIGLPFTPTLGCRIDFHGMSLSQLTPSKLLAEKLVFSPVPAPKRSLGAISEESTMDIGKELDRYQLELENSINEAKLRKNGILTDEQDKPRISLEVELPKDTPSQVAGAAPKVSLVVETDSQEVVMQEVRKGDAPVERRLICTRRHTLTEISEEQQVEEMEEKEPEPEEPNQEELKMQEREKQKQQEQEDLEKQKRLQEQLKEKLKEREREKELQAKEKEDVVYASDESEEEDLDDLDFKAPVRFVRAYRPAAQPTKAPSKESLQSIGSSKSTKSAETKAHGGGGVKNMIRKSIRRLMHPTQHTQSSPEKAQPEEQANHGHHHNIINTIRHSLRRRPQKMSPLEDEEEEEKQTPALPDVSIIDTSERTMKLRSSVAQTEYMTIEQLTNEKKHTLRNSIRRSTRDVLRHVLFHKSHDAYATAK
ncbi:hypothetical protein KR074_009369 [Drosophila pseudoananassae]|nr:hypothetical protein KR074_009369 [Drosophila pseudoananassae]